MTETRIKYTTINHDARIRLGLSWHEYGLADLIYNLGNNPESPYRGWCYAKKEYLAIQLGISRRAVTTMIAKLLDKGLIEKHPETKHLRITIDWYREVLIKSDQREETSHSEKKVLSQREETSHRGEKKLPTTKILNKDIDRKNTVEADASVNGKNVDNSGDNRTPYGNCSGCTDPDPLGGTHSEGTYQHPFPEKRGNGVVAIGDLLKRLKLEPDARPKHIVHPWQDEAVRIWKEIGLSKSPSKNFFKLVKLAYQKGKQGRLAVALSYCKDAENIKDIERLFYWRFYNNPTGYGSYEKAL